MVPGESLVTSVRRLAQCQSSSDWPRLTPLSDERLREPDTTGAATTTASRAAVHPILGSIGNDLGRTSSTNSRSCASQGRIRVPRADITDTVASSSAAAAIAAVAAVIIASVRNGDSAAGAPSRRLGGDGGDVRFRASPPEESRRTFAAMSPSRYGARRGQLRQSANNRSPIEAPSRHNRAADGDD